MEDAVFLKKKQQKNVWLNFNNTLSMLSEIVLKG